ncbi:MAG: hypothetical protein U0X75_26410 [Acidobacteriota bacterium]
MRSILFGWFMVIFAMTALAQSSQGRIVDLNGNGVAGVEIVGEGRCFPSAGALAKAQMSVFSAADGTFTWPETGAPGLGSNCAATLTYSFTLKKDGLVFTRGSFFSKPPTAFPSLYPNYDERLPMIQATGLPSWSGVSAANFSRTFNESIFQCQCATGAGKPNDRRRVWRKPGCHDRSCGTDIAHGARRQKSVDQRFGRR